MDLDIILILGVLALLIWLLMSKPANYPPGPHKWPIVGNAFQMRVKDKMHIAMQNYYRKYGEVVGFFAGNLPVVLVSGVDALHEVASRDDFNGRPTSVVHKLINNGNMYGIVNLDGDIWKAQRRFTLKNLRDLGFGKRTLEGIALEEIQAVFEDIDRISGGPENNFAKPVNFIDILGGTSINVLWHTISGERYEHGDPNFKHLIKCVQTYIQSRQTRAIMEVFPFLRKIFPSLSNLGVLIANRRPLVDFIKNQIHSHEETIDYSNPRDFMDMYLSEIEKEKINPDSSFNVNQLVQICLEMFMAGTDTTLNTLGFAVLYMILYPEVQKKVQNTIDEVVGKDRLLSLEDRAKLPYIEATINEILRLSSIVPLCVPHSPFTTGKDISFRGYRIPKGTRVLLNLYDLHHDPKIWDEPSKFNPERFLDKGGKLVHKEAFMTFGLGKRVCLGESLARNNLFLFFSAILQRYSLKVPDGHPTPSPVPQGRGLLIPEKFEVQVQLRK